MSRVRLDREWTDAEGIAHDVDLATLAELRQVGIVIDGVPPAPPRGGAGPTARADHDDAIDIDDTDLGR